MNIQHFPIKIINRALHFLLKNDPTMINEVRDLEGKVLQITILPTERHLYLIPQHSGLEITTEYSGFIHTTLTASAIDLLRMIRNSGKSNNVTISGDTEHAQKIKTILSQINFDWEEYLSQYTGDVVAHQIGYHLRGIKKIILRTTKSLQENMTEYLQEEKKLLVPQSELNAFVDDVNETRHSVARLQKRIELLSTKLKERNTV